MRLREKHGAVITVAVFILIVVLLSSLHSVTQGFAYYNEYGEGATISVGAMPGFVTGRGEWIHNGYTVTKVSWTYSVTISGLKGVAHWNITVYFGYRLKGTSTIKQLDSFSLIKQTKTGTFSDSGSEDLDTHIGRYVNPQDDTAYTLEYFVRYVFSYLGAKSGKVYNVTQGWVNVANGTVVYNVSGGGSGGGTINPGFSWLDSVFVLGVASMVIIAVAIGRRRR